MFNHLTNKARLLNYPAKTLIYIVAGWCSYSNRDYTVLSRVL